MTRNEAKKALADGKKLTHVHFTNEEWVKGVGSLYEFEDGCLCDPFEFWFFRTDSGFDSGWSLIK